MKKLIVAAVLSLCCLLLMPAVASASTPTLKSLAKTVAALQKTVKSQTKSIASLKSGLASAKLTIATQGTTLTAQAATLTAQAATLSAAAPLLAIAPYVSLNATTDVPNGVYGPTILFSSCNVQVRSTWSEEDVSHLGNLIVGWNTAQGSPPTPYRTGCNNLVVGQDNNYTGFGGFVAGMFNTVGGYFSSVSGGQCNIAAGSESSVSGGGGNSSSWGVTENGTCGWAAGGPLQTIRYETH